MLAKQQQPYEIGFCLAKPRESTDSLAQIKVMSTKYTTVTITLMKSEQRYESGKLALNYFKPVHSDRLFFLLN